MFFYFHIYELKWLNIDEKLFEKSQIVHNLHLYASIWQFVIALKYKENVLTNNDINKKFFFCLIIYLKNTDLQN